MFIIKPEPTREMRVMLRGIKMKMGEVPPHWELYAGINPRRFKMFMEEINYLTSHEHINPDFFTFLRYYIATAHGFGYCKRFNHAYLLSKGYTVEQLESLVASKEALPLDERHRILYAEVINAMDDPSGFTSDTIEHLHSLGWDDADVYDALDHAAFLFKFHKILEAYLGD